MEFYIFVLDNQIIGSGQALLLDEGVQNIPITEEVFNLYVTDKEAVIWDEDNQEVIINPDYEALLAQRRREEFNKEFFKTTAGYIRRKAHMKDGAIKDFITDLIPLMIGTPNIPVIVYAEPDFTKEVTEETLIGLQSMVFSTPQLIDECKNQAIIDFYGYNPMELLQQQQGGEPVIEEPEPEEPIIEEPTEPEEEPETNEPVIEPFEEIIPLDSEEIEDEVVDESVEETVEEETEE